MYEDFFYKRIIQLRMAKNVSARDMSLSIGQSESYMNKIDNRKAFPSMQLFFYICEYFGITPREFFDDGVSNPVLVQSIVDDLSALNEKQIINIAQIIKDVKK